MVGNAHFEHNPIFDHVKYAQAIYYMERIAKYIRENKGMSDSLPFISGGDFNSQPISSGLSAFHNEDIESSPALLELECPSVWTIPSELSKERKDIYKKLNSMF